MKKSTLLLTFTMVILPFVTFAQTTISGGDVFGIWDIAGSPYQILDDVTIQPGATLVIEPGVEIISEPNVDIKVLGRLLAIGEVDNVITFTASNQTISGWGGIEFHDSSNDDSEISYSTIEYALAGVWIHYAQPILNNLIFTQNSTGIFGEDNHPYQTQHEINNVDFFGNEIGFFAQWRYPSKLSYCKFYNNSTAGVYLADHSDNYEPVEFSHCLIYNNHIGFKSIGYERLISLTNCTITNNETSELVLESPVSGNEAIIENSILWGGEFEDGIVLVGNANPDVIYSNVSIFNSVWQGEGNINEDPLFNDISVDDYSLNCNSPCVDAGNPDSPPDPDNSVTDMGAIWFDASALGGSVSNNSPACEGSDVTLMAEGGDSYEWSGVNGFISSSQNPVLSSVSPEMEGEYSVTITTGDGCLIELSTEVVVNLLPTAGISGDLEFCEGSSTDLTADGGATYEWSTGETTASISVTTGNDYTVTVTNDNGCTDTETVTVIVNDLPSVEFELERDTFCINETDIELIGGTPNGGIYSGSGITGNIFDPSTAGVGTHLITYTYEDTNGCVNSDSQEIEVEDGDCTTGINTIEINESVKVYPNPSSGNFSISLEDWTGRINIQIYDAQGRIIHMDNKESNQFEIENIPIGIYFLKVSNDKFVASKILMVQ